MLDQDRLQRAKTHISEHGENVFRAMFSLASIEEIEDVIELVSAQEALASKITGKPHRAMLDSAAGGTPLLIAILRARPDAALALIRAGCDVDAGLDTDMEQIPIIQALDRDMEDVAIALMEAGANLDVADFMKTSPIALAAKKRCWVFCERAAALARAGKIPARALDGQDWGSRTAIHSALLRGRESLALEMIRAGAGFNASDGFGCDLLSWASGQGFAGFCHGAFRLACLRPAERGGLSPAQRDAAASSIQPPPFGHALPVRTIPAELQSLADKIAATRVALAESERAASKTASEPARLRAR